MRRLGLFGTALIVVGLLVILWTSSNWPIVGVVMMVLGFAMLLRRSIVQFRSAAPTQYSEMLWRRNAGGPPPTTGPRSQEGSRRPGT